MRIFFHRQINFVTQEKLSEKRIHHHVFVFGVSIGGPRHGDLQKIGKKLQENYEALKDQGFNYFENKTGNAHMNITLNKFGKEVLKAYNFQFPHVPSNFRMNQNLKAIAGLLEWDEFKDIPIYNSEGRVLRVDRIALKQIFSTKFMRKTAISIDAALGVPVQIGMKRSGHTTYNSYKRYLNIDKSAMDQANSKWDKIFAKVASKPSRKKKRNKVVDKQKVKAPAAQSTKARTQRATVSSMDVR